MADRAQKSSAFELMPEVWGRRKWLAVAVFAVVFAAVGGLAAFLPNVYRSTATVLVERHQVPETFVRSSITGELETRLQTISQEILSRARLAEQEARLRDFRARHTGELPQQMAVNMATVERLQGQLQLNSANQLRAMEQRAALVKQLAESGAAGVGGGPDTATARLAKLKRDLVALRTQFSDRYPDVIRVKEEIAALEREL